MASRVCAPHRHLATGQLAQTRHNQRHLVRRGRHHPHLQCASGCPLDAASATKIASAPANGGLGPWATNTFSATSLALSTPTTTRVLPATEVYRADLTWTLASGP